MNINFHYAAIKVIAGHAGFSDEETEVIAYSSQFVDDASMHEPINLDRDPGVPGIRFERGEFDPICTAHKDIDYLTNITKPRAHERVYVCFHFIPSFKGQSRYKKFRQAMKDGPFARKLVKDALDELSAIPGEYRTRGLIRLGIALHSYADTWAHQGFSGYRNSEDNDIRSVRIKEGSTWKKVGLASWFVSYAAPDLGHAEAGALPDRSDVSWDCKPAKVKEMRSNTTEFLDASEAILTLLRAKAQGAGTWADLKPKLKRCLENPAAKMDGGDCEWKRTFPGIDFKYDADEWFEEALERDGGLFDLFGDFLGVDPLDYEVLAGKKYFHFHAMALEQRNAVLDKLPNPIA